MSASVTRLLVTGSRDWSNWHAVGDALAAELLRLSAGLTLTVVHGACPTGADMIADSWATSPTIAARHSAYMIQAERHPANWDRACDGDCRHRPRVKNGRPYCPMAGHMRNQAMVDLGADVMLAFPLGTSRGTRDCMRRARAASIPVRVVDSG